MSDHREVITSISQKEFGTEPGSITRMTNGICNEVYLVGVADRELVFRLKDDGRYMLGSHNHIPIFRSKGIRVPEIVAEDYSKTRIPFAYQVQTKIEGRDINDVIATLSEDELQAIGVEIANVLRQLKDVPNNGRFGVQWGDDRDLVGSWPEEIDRAMKVMTARGRRNGLMEPDFEQILSWINTNYRDHFERVRPTTYFADMCAKNVMIHERRFAGLVDVDALTQGDPLEAVGRIKASWYGTHHGRVYTDAVMDSLELSAVARRIVTMYALFNRMFWTFENGISFNQNTTGVVDPERELEDKDVVRALYAELRGAMRQVTKPVPALETSPTAHAVALAAVVQAETLPPPIVAPSPARVPDAASNGHRPIVLEALGLSKTYVSDGIGFDALKNIDLKIYRGECVAIVGKSGSGKSTLMHLLACLDGPTEGYVYVDGHDTSAMSETLKNVLRNEQFGFVFQQFFLNGRDTVYENVVLPMRIRGSGTTELDMEAREALTAVGLADKRHKKAKDLSGGEKQRVCIARALITKPKVIFADEPTGNLDSATGAAVEQLLFDLNRQKGITLVIVTHDADLAAKCDRVIEMKDGRVISDSRVRRDR